jgi:glucokinase
MLNAILLCNLAIKGCARLALVNEQDGILTSGEFPAGDAPGFESAVNDFLDENGAPFLTAAAISAPGWEQDGIQRMPNHGYDIERERLRRVFNVKRLHIVNPTVARAMAIPNLTPKDYVTLSPGNYLSEYIDATRCVVGTGPGLGVAVVMKDADDQWTAFAGAGGHMDLPAASDEQFAVFRHFRARYGHVSIERAVSMGGLVDIFQALGDLEGASSPSVSADDIIRLAHGGHTRAKAAIAMCLDWLARASADFVLTTGARGGLYLTGQLVDMLSPFIDGDHFGREFRKNGRIGDYLSAVPAYHVTSPDADFKGLQTLFH